MEFKDELLLKNVAHKIELLVGHCLEDIDINEFYPDNNFIFSGESLRDSEDLFTVDNCGFTNEQIKLAKKYKDFLFKNIANLEDYRLKRITKNRVKFQLHCASER